MLRSTWQLPPPLVHSAKKRSCSVVHFYILSKKPQLSFDKAGRCGYYKNKRYGNVTGKVSGVAVPAKEALPLDH